VVLGFLFTVLVIILTPRDEILRGVQDRGRLSTFLNSKYTEYRLVFFWSLVLGVQTPEDGRTVFLRLEQQLT